jgi:hypothetical protein
MIKSRLTTDLEILPKHDKSKQYTLIRGFVTNKVLSNDERFCRKISNIRFKLKIDAFILDKFDLIECDIVIGLLC